MKRLLMLIVFVVSWDSGQTFVAVPCEGHEAKEIVCSKAVMQRAAKKFKTREAADEFATVMREMKAPNVTIDKAAK
jgi:hypothetical protein